MSSASTMPVDSASKGSTTASRSTLETAADLESAARPCGVTDATRPGTYRNWRTTVDPVPCSARLTTARSAETAARCAVSSRSGSSNSGRTGVSNSTITRTRPRSAASRSRPGSITTRCSTASGVATAGAAADDPEKEPVNTTHARATDQVERLLDRAVDLSIEPDMSLDRVTLAE